MKRFKFPLQRLLEIKEHKEKLIKNELGKAMAKKVKQVEEKNKIIKEYKKYLSLLSDEEKAKIISIQKLQSYQNYFHSLELILKYKDKLIEIANQEIVLINKKLIDARKEKRILERLKEKQYKKHLHELQREEQNFFDEVGNISFARGMKKETRESAKQSKQHIPLHYVNREPHIYETILKEFFGGPEK